LFNSVIVTISGEISRKKVLKQDNQQTIVQERLRESRIRVFLFSSQNHIGEERGGKYLETSTIQIQARNRKWDIHPPNNIL